jgi:hypothetical protein
MLRSTDRIRAFTSAPGTAGITSGGHQEEGRGRPYDEAALRWAATAVAAVVKRQSECGLDSVCDGEFGKQNFTSYVIRGSAATNQRSRPGDAPLLSFGASDATEFPTTTTDGETLCRSRHDSHEPVSRARVRFVTQASKPSSEIEIFRQALNGCYEEALLPAAGPAF